MQAKNIKYIDSETKIKPKAVIFDIDVVLAEKSPGRGYREYDKVDLDKPVQQGFELLGYYHTHGIYNIIFITGRKEFCREKTTAWLVEQSYLSGGNISSLKLFMRGDTDHRESETLKKEIYDNHIKDKYDVVAVFEDDPEVAQMYKKEGLFVFQVLR